MPLPPVWNLAVQNQRLYVKCGGEVQVNRGPLIGVRESKEKPNHIKAKFLKESRPRLLPLDVFAWDANNLSKKFRGCQNGEGFADVWQEQIVPYLSPSTGLFQFEEVSDDSAHGTEPVYVSPTSRKRPSTSLSPPTLMPTAKASRTLEVGTPSEVEMDRTIQDHFIGFYMLPVSSLHEPPAHLLLRDTNEVFVGSLKKEMMENPTGDVQPLLCIVRLEKEQQFDAKFKEAYPYDTVGGNNSRCALQELLKEHPELRNNKLYTHRLCSVYKKMDTQLTLRLASKHNRATSFNHEMTTWDKVLQCRKLLFELAHVSYSEDSDPPEKPPKWKSVCSTVLSSKVEQLDDGMVFYFASLSTASYKIAKQVFYRFSNAELKGQKVPRSKKGVHSKPPDLKGSTMKCLRGLEPNVVHDLLQSVAAGDTSLHELACQCTSIKQLSKIQSAFIKATNCSSWSEAEEKYPEFIVPEKLEVFKKLNFSRPTMPVEFMRYCQKAMKKGDHLSTEGTTTYTGDHVFALEHVKTDARGIFWNHDMLEMNGSSLEHTFAQVQDLGGRPVHFPGFSLAIFDLPDGRSADEEEWTGQHAQKLTMLVRAINYNLGKQMFTVVFLTHLEGIATISQAVKMDGDMVQSGVVGISVDSTKGDVSCLEESVYGIVFLCCGGSRPLRNAQNFFTTKSDPLYLDEQKRVLNSSQKPLAVMEWIISLYSNPGDWILDGLSGTGSGTIAALSVGRNAVAVEIDHWQFLYSQIRAVELFSSETEGRLSTSSEAVQNPSTSSEVAEEPSNTHESVEENCEEPEIEQN